ncbi:MAG TPA: class I SAM-dependent methyltransferase [Phycisphaerae bacterium]|nr:class I SAM-dependent methyltransferase [Phycisphaerae bacterium]
MDCATPSVVGPADWRLEHAACDYCGTDRAQVLLTGRDRLHGLPGEFRVVTCAECGLARTDPRPAAESLAAAYPDEYGPHQGRALRARRPRGLLRWALVNFRGYPMGRKWPAPLRMLGSLPAWAVLRRRRALRYLPFVGEGRLLDYGCGAGGYVATMAAAGWRAEGMDLSDAAVATGREAGLTLHQGTLPGARLPAGSFDAVTMWQVIEHVPSPMATLRASRELLRPGGLLLVACPRIDSLPARWFGRFWHDLDLPRHLWHFSLATLTRHMESAGLEVVRSWAVRRPSGIRRSFAFLAAESGNGLHRLLAHSRAAVGMMTCLALAARRTAQMYVLARRPE